MHATIASPIDYGGITLKNRVIFAPTTMGLAEDAYLARMHRIAEGGCALVIVGDVPVGKTMFGASLRTRKGMAHYRAVAQAIHEGGALACAQLHQSDSNMAAMLKYVPGVLTKRISMEELRPLLNQEVGPYVSGMSRDKLRAIAASFGPAAVLAREAGFDMVQVHGDRMCGSLCSPIFNRRTDEYGGSLENRLRFACEAVAAVRRALPDVAIDYKLAVRMEEPHYGNAGLAVGELAQAVPLLEAAGVTSFHVALANHSSLDDTIPAKRHPYFGAEGCFLGFCDEVRRHTSLPVCGVGGLTSPDFVEEQLAGGRVDCVAMSRQLIADPDWPRKVIESRADEVRRCVRCNKDCLGGMQRHQGVHCIFEKSAGTQRRSDGR